MNKNLTAPRVICIGEEKGKRLYPHGDVFIGDVLTLDSLGYVYGSETGRWVGKSIVSEYPHLFRQLEWWEERNPEDMPRFIKGINGNIMFEISEFKVKENSYFIKGNKYPYPINKTLASYEPATEQEYFDYIIKKHDTQLEKEKLFTCPYCASTNVVYFDADNDLCRKCGRWFPAL